MFRSLILGGIKNVKKTKSQPRVCYSQWHLLSAYDSELSKRRGPHGVWSLSDLIEALKLQKASDIAVIKISPELDYCSHMVLANARSTRHLVAMAWFIKKLHKLRKFSSDSSAVIEGEDCPNWKVINLGNIVLHMFLQETRLKYDLESLWCVGHEFDEKVQHSNVNEVEDIIEKQLAYLGSLGVSNTEELNEREHESADSLSSHLIDVNSDQELNGNPIEANSK